MNLCESHIVSFVKEIATDYGFNVWDWCAVLISFCSAIVALVSLLIASKTLKSQKKTEKNTTPLIDKKIQIFLLNNSLRELYESLVSVTALFSALELTNYKVYPSKQFWKLVYLDSSNFHKELFYGEEEKFRELYYLVSYIEKFNSDVSDLQECISKKDITNSLKREIILHISEDIGDLLQLWTKVYLSSLGLTKSDMLELIEKYFIKCSHCKFNTIYNDEKKLIKYYIQNSPFETQVEEIVNTFSSRIAYLVYAYSLDYNKSEFKTNLWHFVDAVMLNVLYEDAPFAAYALKDSLPENAKKNIVFHTGDNDTIVSRLEPKIQIRRQYSWLFYLKNI